MREERSLCSGAGVLEFRTWRSFVPVCVRVGPLYICPQGCSAVVALFLWIVPRVAHYPAPPPLLPFLVSLPRVFWCVGVVYVLLRTTCVAQPRAWQDRGYVEWFV